MPWRYTRSGPNGCSSGAGLAADRLRSARVRRESYVGPWLPEPMLTSPDVAENVVLADSVSTAMLLVLEALSPVKRAVFVLSEAFTLHLAGGAIKELHAVSNPEKLRGVMT